MTRTVDLDELTAEDLRHLAGIKDGEPARLQSIRDEYLRRHLLRLTALMPPADRQAVLALPCNLNPGIVLAQHFRAFLSAQAARALLPLEEKGWLCLPCDVVPCDGPSTEQPPDVEQFVREIARLERCTPDVEQFVANAYAAAAAIGITSEEARPIIVTALRARNNPKEYRRAG